MFYMDREKNVAVMSNKTKVFSVIDGKLRKKDYSVKKTLWMPASAGMTTGVGGTSH